jgi:hypothetical protein
MNGRSQKALSDLIGSVPRVPEVLQSIKPAAQHWPPVSVPVSVPLLRGVPGTMARTVALSVSVLIVRTIPRTTLIGMGGIGGEMGCQWDGQAADSSLSI